MQGQVIRSSDCASLTVRELIQIEPEPKETPYTT